MRPAPPPDLAALRAHEPFLRSLARSLVRDPHAADDVVQETWLAWLRRPPDSHEASRSWLARVGRNFAALLVRGESRRRAREESAARPERVRSTAEIVEREAVRRRVLEVVLALEEPFRTAVLLRFYDDLPPRAIARELDVGVATVKSRLRRGLERLRERLDGEHGGGRREWLALLLPLARPSTLAALAVVCGRPALRPVAAALAAVLVGALFLLDPPARSASRPPATRAAEPRASEATAAAESPASPARDDAARAAAAAAPVPDGRPRITGRVLDGLGRPVAGAEVRTAPDNPRRALAPGPAAAVTGPDGRFAVPLAGGAPFFTLLVDAPRFAPAWQAAARPGSDVTITLERPGTLAGTARDRDGRPLGGARLRWLGLRGTTRFERETVAAADGTWRFDDLPALRDRRGRPWWLEARADGLAPLFLETLPSDPPPESPLDLVLVEGATVEGRVEDAETGAPVGGARVWLASHEGVPGLFRGDGLFLPNPHVPRRLQETRAAADGSFRFVHVPARGLHAPSAPGGAAFSLSAVAPGAAFASMEVPLLPDGAVWEARLRSAPAGAVRGRVLDGDGRPVPGAEVTAGPEPLEDRLHEPGSPFPRWWAQADADGRYRIPAVPASRTRAHAFEVRARLPGGLASAAALVAPLAGAEVEAPDLVVLPDPGATVLVTDRDGRPVWGAMPSLQIVDPRVLEQRTGPDGRMRVRLPRDAAAAGPIRLRFRASGHATMLTPPLHLTEASAGETRVTLGPPCPVSGRVVRAEGGPAAGAVVHAALSWLSLDEVLAHAARALEPDAGTSGIVASTSTDDEGRFSLDDLPAGPHRLVAVEGGRAATVVAAAPAAGASLVLPPSPAAPATGVVEGSVRDASGGRAPVDFEVVLTAGARRIVARPAAPGRFRIEGVAAGSWRLTLAAPGFVPRVEEGLAVRAEAPAVLELALERGAVVTGRVAVPDGVEPAGVELVFAPERGGPPPRVALDGSGRFRLAGFAPGRYRARVEAGPGRPPLAPAGSGVLVVPASAPAVACDLELVIGAAGSSR